MHSEHRLPAGFRFAAVKTQVKKSADLDLALIVADDPCVAAGVYTQNLVHAASIDWNRQITPTSNLARSLSIREMRMHAPGSKESRTITTIAETVARAIRAGPNRSWFCQRASLATPCRWNKITAGIAVASGCLAADQKSWHETSRAILTTDQGAKMASRSLEIDGTTATIHGIAKDAGMIGPRMATLLCVILTDVGLEPAQAQATLTEAVDGSFNRISVEGHTSTNDAGRLAWQREIGHQVRVACRIGSHFQLELNSLCIELAKMIPTDGEGAKHLIEIEVNGANSHDEADRIARTVANSNLVKTAISGNDPNWGRIVSAVGYCEGIHIDAAQIELTLNGFELFADGRPLAFDAAEVSQSMAANKQTRIELSVGDGPGCAKHWTSDLTEAYVRFNSHYTT